MKLGPRHQCIIYSGAPSEKLPALTAIMCSMMEEGFRCLYLNSAPMIAGIRSSLASMGVDVPIAIAEGRLVLSSEPVAVNDNFNIDDMLQKLENAVDEALKDGYKGLWASGDMTWELGSQKNFEKVMEYEWKLEELFQKRKELRGICQYHHDTLPRDTVATALVTHKMVFINETLSRLNPHYCDPKLSPDIKDRLLDKTIAALCESNSEINRRKDL
jgi:hypothetical protein